LANTPKQQHRIGIAGDVVVGVTLDRVSRHRDAGAAGQNFVRICSIRSLAVSMCG
jgi:hypothetical protein